MTNPPESQPEPAPKDWKGDSADIQALIEKDFRAFDPDYDARKAAYAKPLAALEAELLKLQEQGNAMACSDQAYVEAKWLLAYMADWPRLEGRLAKLRDSLKDADQGFAEKQSPKDGSWGPCYDEWFLKVDAMIDPLNELAETGRPPDYPLDFLAPIATPDKMAAYLTSIMTSDIANTGIDQRDALGAVSTVLSQICFKKDLRAYVAGKVQGFDLSEAYVARYRALIDGWQDQDTGYWGAWFFSEGRLYKSNDLSFTFHTISYRKGDVNLWPKIVDTTFAIKEQTYPYGWMHNGTYNNHNDYDLVKIFRYGWPHMDQAQKERAEKEIDGMLDWCLNKSMEPDGAFIDDPTFYNSVGSAYYFGVSFLDDAGYFDKSKRFWTDRDFPGGKALCEKILAKMKALGLADPESLAAIEKLEDSCGGC